MTADETVKQKISHLFIHFHFIYSWLKITHLHKKMFV